MMVSYFFFILDFNIRGFFGLGIHHKQFLTYLTFHLAIFAVGSDTKLKLEGSIPIEVTGFFS
jgi:hypothetical protein